MQSALSKTYYAHIQQAIIHYNVSVAVVMINFCRLHFETTFRYTINYNYLYFKTINNFLINLLFLNKFLLF